MAGFSFALVYVGFLDELASGIPIVSAPQIRAAFALDFASVSLVLLALPGLSALLVEAPLLVLARRLGRRRLVVVSLWSMAVCAGVAALSTQVWPLALAFVLWSPATGVATGLCKAALMDAAPERRERSMSRWTLMGAVGDVVAPGSLALLAWAGYGWRAGMAMVAVLLGWHGWVVGRRRWPIAKGAGAGDALVRHGWGAAREGVRAEAKRPRRQRKGKRRGSRACWNAVGLVCGAPGLGWWLFGVLLCGLLDEVLLAFGTLYLHERFEASASQQAGAFVVFSLGSVLGLALTERLLVSINARRLLACSSLGCALLFPSWLCSHSLVESMVLLALLGAFAAPLFPIATAQCYRAAPGCSAAVAALMQLATPLELSLPLCIGWIADRAGLGWALLTLGLQPVGMLAVLWATRPAGLG